MVDGELRNVGTRVVSLARASWNGSDVGTGYRGITPTIKRADGVEITGARVIIDYVMSKTDTATSYSFTNSHIDSNVLIDVYSSIYGENPTNVVQSDTTITVTFADSQARTVAIVFK